MPIATGPLFATIRDVRTTATATGFTVTARTDAAIQLQLDWWSQTDPTMPGPGTAPVEAGPTTVHSFTVTLPAGNRAGYVYGFSFRKDSNDTSGLNWRPYQGVVQTLGARTTTNGKAVPVRWNTFGDGTRPPDGGGTGPLKNGPNSGNWSSYTWAQYNPKGTTFPTP